MIALIVIIITVIAGIAAWNNGHWGSVAIACVIVVAAVVMHCGAVNESKAHQNWVDYWARGGPEQRKRNRRR